MFSLFKKKPRQSFTDFSFLGVDIHSHIIPGIDDGAKTMDDSMELIKGLQSLGFDKIITTPHVMAGHYPNSSTRIKTIGDDLKLRLQRNNSKISFEYSAEYNIDELFEKLVAQNDLVPFPDNYLLVEMSFISAPANLENIIFQLKINGYRPILAHPERYLFWSRDFKKYERLKELGCLFQLNLLSLVGNYGPVVLKNTQKMLKANLFDLAGTDAHRTDHIDQLKKGLDKGDFYLLNDYKFKNKQLLAKTKTN